MAFDTDKFDKQLAGMSRAEVVEMRDYVDTYLRQTEGEAKEAARQAAIELLKAQGFTPADLFGNASPAQARGKTTRNTSTVEPKYRHPENPELTWAGRGRKPRWLQDHEESGGNIEDFAIAS